MTVQNSDLVCKGGIFGIWNFEVNIFNSESDNFVYGIARLISFVIILGLNAYNRKLLKDKLEANITVEPNLILPHYFYYLYLFTLFSFFVGFLDVLLTLADYTNPDFNHFLVSSEQALFHFLYEGLSLFLMRYGAGVHAIRRSFYYSFLWSIFTFFIFIFVITSFYDDKGKGNDYAFYILNFYYGLLFYFYLILLLIPSSIVYRRKAFNFYAKFNVFNYFINILFINIIYAGNFEAVCAFSYIIFIISSFGQPLALYQTLKIDSQYWQGLIPDPGNPLASVWDHLDIGTAQEMANALEISKNSSLPVIPYGYIDFDSNTNFVAGGYSRVYFGLYKKREIALKVLFSMELTPNAINDFYSECLLLHSLKHPHVVECIGICVMPPAMSIVLEFAEYGSLFDFLYKPVKSNLAKLRDKENAYAKERETTVDFSSQTFNVLKNLLKTNSTNSSIGRFSLDNRDDKLEMNNLSNKQVEVSNPIISNNDKNKIDLEDEFDEENTKSFCSYRSSNYGGWEVYQDSFDRGSEYFKNGTFTTYSDARASYSYAKKIISKPSTDPKNKDKELPPAPPVTHKKLFSKVLNAMINSINPSKDNASNNSSTNNQDGSEIGGFKPISSAYGLPLETRLRMMRDVVDSILFLHSKKLFHCDIKSLNFLVCKNYVVKIADLGQVRPADSMATYETPPTPARNWCPPEILLPTSKSTDYTDKSEIYAISLVLTEIIRLELPFGLVADRMSASNWYKELVEKKIKPEIDSSVLPEEIYNIIYQGLEVDPTLRPTAKEYLDVFNKLLNK